MAEIGILIDQAKALLSSTNISSHFIASNSEALTRFQGIQGLRPYMVMQGYKDFQEFT